MLRLGGQLDLMLLFYRFQGPPEQKKVVAALIQGRNRRLRQRCLETAAASAERVYDNYVRGRLQHVKDLARESGVPRTPRKPAVPRRSGTSSSRTGHNTVARRAMAQSAAVSGSHGVADMTSTPTPRSRRIQNEDGGNTLAGSDDLSPDSSLLEDIIMNVLVDPPPFNISGIYPGSAGPIPFASGDLLSQSKHESVEATSYPAESDFAVLNADLMAEIDAAAREAQPQGNIFDEYFALHGLDDMPADEGMSATALQSDNLPQAEFVTGSGGNDDPFLSMGAGYDSFLAQSNAGSRWNPDKDEDMQQLFLLNGQAAQGVTTQIQTPKRKRSLDNEEDEMTGADGELNNSAKRLRLTPASTTQQVNSNTVAPEANVAADADPLAEFTDFPPLELVPIDAPADTGSHVENGRTSDDDAGAILPDWFADYVANMPNESRG